MDFINELGALALATRLKRLGERLGNDVNRIYKELDLDFESRWFLVLALLKKEKEMPVVAIADTLKLSHPAIIQFSQQMEKAGLVTSSTSSLDARKRLIALSAKGDEMYDKLLPVLEVINKENQDWLSESRSDFLSIVEGLEKSLDNDSMYNRISSKL